MLAANDENLGGCGVHDLGNAPRSHRELQHQNDGIERHMKALLRSLTPPILYKAMHDAKMLLPRATKYRIGEHVIAIPADHNLPIFQEAHRLYDRFLPVLCSQFPPNGVIVDVGANVGDTVAAIMQTCANPIVAIEGHLPYFDILRANLEAIDPQHRVTPLNALVGTGAKAGTLVAHRGTATLDVSGSGAMQSLDALLAQWRERVLLIKVDTDGFDADVLLSGTATLKASQPLLFWEGGTTGARSFASMYDTIAATGYEFFWVFDNFGNLMQSECGTKELKDFDRYVESLYNHRCTGSISYVDVLASTLKTMPIARAAIEKYRRENIEI